MLYCSKYTVQFISKSKSAVRNSSPAIQGDGGGFLARDQMRYILKTQITAYQPSRWVSILKELGFGFQEIKFDDKSIALIPVKSEIEINSINDINDLMKKTRFNIQINGQPGDGPTIIILDGILTEMC